MGVSWWMIMLLLRVVAVARRDASGSRYGLTAADLNAAMAEK